MSHRKFVFITTAVLAQAISTPSLSQSPCSNAWLAGPFSPLTGPNGNVTSMTVWDPDGLGPQPDLLVVGGSFTEVAGLSANRIAAWNGANWQTLGSGFDGSVRALAVYNGLLYAAGSFTTAGGAPANRIAVWNGATWADIGGLGSVPGQYPNALAVYNGELIAAGDFKSAGGVPVNNIARYNGSAWQPLGPGLGNNGVGIVWALTVWNSKLVAGGLFTSNGIFNVGQWNGSNWSELDSDGDSPNGAVRALTVHGVHLWAGGDFTAIGNLQFHYAASIHPTVANWGASFPGPAHPIVSLQSHGGLLYAGANFSPYIQRYGTTWESTGGAEPVGSVLAMTTFRGQLIAGGGVFYPADRLAQFNQGTSVWAPVAAASPQVFAFTPFGSRMIAGGAFVHATSAGPLANNIVAFDGLGMRLLGMGMDGAVNALVSLTNSSGDNELVAVGSFTAAGGVSANRVARWIEDPFVGFPPPLWEPMGNGFNGAVQSLTMFRGRHVAGGSFTASGNGATSLSRIARWNSATSAWEPMGTGMNGTVAALKAYTVSSLLARVVAAGYFTMAGGVAANYLASWTENTQIGGATAWAPLGTGFNNAVLALEYHSGSLYAAGTFTTAGGVAANRIARWNTVPNPDVWEPLGGGFNGNVTALKSVGTLLYAAGDFTMAGGVSANRVAVWNGSTWAAVPDGPEAAAYALGLFNNELHVGGAFSLINTPVNIKSKGWARYLPNNAPWLVQHPQSQSLPCFSTVVFSATPASGYTGLTFQWRKNAVPLVAGATGTGSTIALPADGWSMTISNISHADEGDYDLVVSNACGSVTSILANLATVGDCSSCLADIAPVDGSGFIGDGVVNVTDLLAVITGWGACANCSPPSACPADIAPAVRDCQVNVSDLLAVITSWGACP